MIYEKFKDIKNDRMIKAMIGMSRQKFDELVPLFASAHHAIQEERIQNKEIKRLPSGGPQGVLNTYEKQLFFTLYYLKTYPTFDVLAFHFDLSAGHAHDYIQSYLLILKRALESLNVFPKRSIESPEEFMQIIENYDEIIIDGLEVPCIRPSDQDAQEDRYSGKKKRHTVKALAISSQDRSIIYLSQLFGGRTHDYTMMKNEFNPEQIWFFNVTVRLDLGFLGSNVDYGSLADIQLPHKKPKISKANPSPELTQEQKIENRAHSKIRIAVEHAIGGMKRFYCLTHRIRNHSTSIIDQFFGVSAGLWNYNLS